MRKLFFLVGLNTSLNNGHNEERIGSADRHTRVQGEFLRDGLRETVSITITGDKKNIEINGKRPRQSNEMFGRFPSVLFAPEEVSLPKGFPAGRRALLDRALCQTRPSFLDHALAYQRSFRQWKILLKSGAQLEISTAPGLKGWIQKVL